MRRAKNVNITISKEKPYQFPAAGREAPRLKERPVIIGCGPAGLFCGLMLARAGYRPVILERGADVDTRTAQVKRFWEEGILDLNPTSSSEREEQEHFPTES